MFSRKEKLLVSMVGSNIRKTDNFPSRTLWQAFEENQITEKVFDEQNLISKDIV